MDISVIVPTLNEEKSIEVCLKSIKSQKTNKEYEIIVSDCESEDKTVEIARRYADNIVFSKKKSIAVARNTGAKSAKGKYLVFIDADTVMPENYLEKVFEKFEKDPDLVGFSSGFRFSRNDGKIKLIEKFTNSYLLFRDKIGMVTMPGFSTSVRKEVFDSLNGFKDVLLEDGEFSIRLRRTGKTRYFSDFYVITSS
ncbi:MAG TPA: glycosyltransferase, partial [Candidatus Altiarchaeales archaeon]|nr:glycosyltransferase [Candidatus Altiarchaeales archaeon]